MFARSLLACSRTRIACVTPRTAFTTHKSDHIRLLSTSLKLRAMATFSHLIRFKADDGKTYYGDLTKETPTREIEGEEVEVLEGDIKSGFSKKGSKAKVSKLLCPLPTTNIILCVGLNYRQHAEECNVSNLPCPHKPPADLDSSPFPPTQPSS
jgi:2-keto-4-pentenoate hydratase/2-oxohepta-3-ene-1,7-dioic acid hydratase in catechol pathway